MSPAPVPPTTVREPDGERRAGSVLVVHGLAEHRGRYAYVQDRLAAAGYVSHAVDLRGHGEAEGFPGKVSAPDEWLDDIAAALGRIRAGTDSPVFVIAHSMGTLPALAFLGERGQEGVRGAVLSACPIAPGQATLDSLSSPDAAGIPPEAISRDPEVVRAYVEDPLVFNHDVPPECTAAVMLCAQRAFEGAASVTIPVLLVHGSLDPIADASGSQDMCDALGSPDKILKIYEGLFHEVFNEPERDQVIGDVIAWLDAHR